MNEEAEDNIDTNKIDDAALALFYLTMHGNQGIQRAWKGMDWDVLNRLYEKGLIHDPRNKTKSVVITETGEKKSKELFYKLFAK